MKAVEGLSFNFKRGERRAGSGGPMGVGQDDGGDGALPRQVKPPGRIEGGEVLLDGRNIIALPKGQMRRMRPAEIGFVSWR